MCIGHANPTVGAAVKARIDEGTHFAAPTDGSIAVADRAGTALRPAPVALQQLRHRGDDGRRPPRPRRHRPRHDPQDRGLLPRPSRHRDGLGLPAAGGARRPRRPGQRPIWRRHPHRVHGPHPGRPLQRRRGAGERAGEDRRTGRRPDHGAGDDEHQHHPATPGLPGARARADRPPRHQADLRRGQDRCHDLPRRRHRPLRGHARHDHPGQGQLRRLPRRRDRDERGAGGDRRRRHRQAVRHLQRQPAGDGGGGGDPDRGPHRRRLRALRGDQPAPARRLPGDRRRPRPARLHRGPRRQGLRDLLAASGCTSTATT